MQKQPSYEFCRCMADSSTVKHPVLKTVGSEGDFIRTWHDSYVKIYMLSIAIRITTKRERHYSVTFRPFQIPRLESTPPLQVCLGRAILPAIFHEQYTRL